MLKDQNNYAFIDSQNLYLAVKNLGWKIDYRRFRIYLMEKFHVSKVYMFVGYLCQNNDLYNYWRKCNYEIIFKSIVRSADGKIKGNVDAEMVLQVMIDYPNYSKTVIVTGDGDFACLIKYLEKQSKIARLIIPDKYCYSVLLRRAINPPLISFMNDLQNLLEYKSSRCQARAVGGST